jgi:hypothetical protein
MEFEETELTKIEKFKQHIKDNKKIYITGTICFITGAVVGVFALTRRSVTPEEQYDAFRAYIANRVKGHHNSVTNNNTFQTISQYGNVIGRPGNHVIDTTTWKEFNSQSLAAQSVGVSEHSMWKHLEGKHPNLNGHTFKRVCDFVTDEV